MQGEAATPLTPDGFTVTGPPTTGASSATDPVVLSILMSSPRLGTSVQAQLQADTLVTDADALVATFTGRDPDSALAYATFQVRGGPSILWGVLPPSATSVTPHLEPGATAGVPVLQRMSNGLTAFAVMVQGDPTDVTGPRRHPRRRSRHRSAVLPVARFPDRPFTYRRVTAPACPSLTRHTDHRRSWSVTGQSRRERNPCTP